MLTPSKYRPLVGPSLDWEQLPHQPVRYAKLKALLPEFSNFHLTGELKNLGELMDGEKMKNYAPYERFVPDPASRHYSDGVPQARAEHIWFFQVLERQFNDVYWKNPDLRKQVDALR